MGNATAVALVTSIIKIKALDRSGVFGSIEIVVEAPLKINSSYVSIYPNPVMNGIIHLPFSDSSKILTYQIFNTAGMVIKSGTRDQTLTIQTGGLSQGIYTLIIKRENQLYNSKLIIQ